MVTWHQEKISKSRAQSSLSQKKKNCSILPWEHTVDTHLTSYFTMEGTDREGVIQEGPDNRNELITLEKIEAKNYEPQDYESRINLTSLLKQVAMCSWYQIMVYTLSLWPQIASGVVLLQNVFILGTPDHRCFLPECDQLSNDLKLHSNLTDRWIDWKDGKDDSSSCHRFLPESNVQGCPTFPSNLTDICRSGYVYDFDPFMQSALSEWNIVCDQEWKKTTSRAIFMSGMLFASIICGWLSDNFGRRSVFLWAPGLSVICGIVAAHSNDIWVYTVFSFVQSFCAYGMVIADFTMGMEAVEKNWRILAGNGYPLAFAIGQTIMTGMFYWTRNWRHGLILISLFNLTLALLPPLLPESLKWQISRGDEEEKKKAWQEIHRAARMNKVSLKITDEDIINQPSPEDYVKRKVDPPAPPTIKNMLRLYGWWVLAMSLGWIASALTYYGLTFRTAGITKSLSFYVSFILLAFVEVPFVFLLTFLMRWLGRKSLFISTAIITGILCLINLVIPANIALWISILGKGVISMTFALVYCYTSEIFTTNMRTLGLGFCSMFARIGTIISPIIADLPPTVAYIILGVLCIITGLVGFVLPETKGRELPESLGDLEELRKKKRRLIG